MIDQEDFFHHHPYPGSFLVLEFFSGFYLVWGRSLTDDVWGLKPEAGILN